MDCEADKSKQNDLPDTKNQMEDEKATQPATFETAIAATGFGKFNIFLMLVTLPPEFTLVFDIVAMSYVFPIAQCDLNLTLEDKGILNAITFAGMITSGFLWGYLCDVTGRKNIMVCGYLLDGFFILMSSLSQNFTMILLTKFFGGLIINGPFSAGTSYLSEFHASRYRARVHIVRGILSSLGTTVIPLLAWGILPQNINFKLFNYFDIYSWNIFLFICSIAPITSGIVYVFMPESPKFLMSAGRNDEALKILEKIYKMNTGNSTDAYPIKRLFEETTQNRKVVAENIDKRIVRKAIVESLYLIKPLFSQSNSLKLLHVCSNSFITMMSINTLKLWFPQLFQAINDYKFIHNDSSSHVCDMLENLDDKNTTSTSCYVNLENSSVYINAIIIGATSIVFFVIAGALVNLLGKKVLSVTMVIICGVCAICIYFSRNSETVLVLSTIFLSFGGVAGNILLTITLELFPTTLRAMALSLHLVSARLGSVFGNVIFPVLLHSGCLPPFLFIGLLIFGCAALTMLYPSTENKELT